MISLYQSKKSKFAFLVIIFLTLFLIWGCDSAKEKVKEAADTADQLVDNTLDKAGEITESATKKLEDTAKDLENTIEDNFLIGTWSGKFDQRKTTLKVTEQNGNDFEGKITINYRDVINQEVKGTLNPENMTITMKDQLHSRFSGKYYGKLNNEKTTYSGQFTMKLDGKKFDFNLKKN